MAASLAEVLSRASSSGASSTSSSASSSASLENGGNADTFASRIQDLMDRLMRGNTESFATRMQNLVDQLQAPPDDKGAPDRESNASPKNKKWGKADTLRVRVKEEFMILNEHLERVDEAADSLQKWIDQGIQTHGEVQGLTPLVRLTMAGQVDLFKTFLIGCEFLDGICNWIDPFKGWCEMHPSFGDMGVADELVLEIEHCILVCVEALDAIPALGERIEGLKEAERRKVDDGMASSGHEDADTEGAQGVEEANKENPLDDEPLCDDWGLSEPSDDESSLSSERGDALHLISTMNLAEHDIDDNWAIVHGERPAGDIVLQIGNNPMKQEDMKRLQGPLPPSGTEPTDLWLNDAVLSCLRTILVDMDSERCAKDKSRKQVYFGDSYFYQKLMDMRNTTEPGKRGKYDYQGVAQQCRRVCPGGSLLDVHASYFPILLNENHWVGSAILKESKEILLFDPRGKKERNTIVLNNLLRLVCDEFRRTQDSNESAIGAFKKKWTLVDVSRDPPCQDNSK
jgi:hypothetical protein